MLMTDGDGERLPEPVAVDLNDATSGEGCDRRFVQKVILRFGGRLPQNSD